MNISLASFISYIKENGDDNGDKDYSFSVLTPYTDVFEICKAVDTVYRPEQVRDFIFDANDRNAVLITHRIYDMNGFIKKNLNYSQAWALLMGIPFTDTDGGTKVCSVLDDNRFNMSKTADNVLKEVKEKGYDDFVIMQFSGGQSPLIQVPKGQRQREDGTVEEFADWSKVAYNYENEPLKRHYPLDKARKFVELFQEEHPTTAVILYQLPNEPYAFDKTFKYTIPYIAYYELAKKPECRGTVSIDSSLQHLVAGVNKSVVVWAHSLPDNFGYSYNKNIIQDCRRNDILYFSELGPSGAAVRYIEPDKLLAEVDGYLFVGKKEEEK